ncbi:Nad Kinase [Manis pentadactyla]|nr:Nad Kinase [Manis pentadactyla]
MALASCSAGAPAWKSSLAKTVPVLEGSWEGLAQGPAQASSGPSIELQVSGHSQEAQPEKTNPSRHPCLPDQRRHSPTVDMEQDRVSVSQGLGTDSASYHCSACHGDEDWGPSHPFRGRAKSRSLSASPATASTKEFRRTRSLHGPCPVTTFGPKACVLQNPQTVMHIQDPASQRLTWNKPPKSVLVIKKIRDSSLLKPFKELCVYLSEENNMIVYVEKKVLEDPAIVHDDSFGPVKKKFCTFREDYDDISNQIDFIICLGGDGTLLYASSLFQGSVPPVMAFHLGSLGFLTPFNFENFQSQVTQVIEGNAAVALRSRLKVRVVKELRGKAVVPNGVNGNGVLAADMGPEVGKQVVQYQVLNEVVIDRGPSSYLSNVDVYLDGHLITTVQGDGVIVSTPTGSTAYAAAAGASMVHPNVPAVMITPICPHSLSFRPIVVPAGVELKIMLSPEARNTVWVSFDGRKRQEIRHGDSISITTSCYPLPSICVRDPVSDWFESLAQCLHWNVRKRQAHFPEEEEDEEGAAPGEG